MAGDDAAASQEETRVSVWLKRRIVVLQARQQEAVELGEIRALHIPERDMVADVFTKFLSGC